MMKSSIGFALSLLVAGALLEACGSERVAAPTLAAESAAARRPLAGNGYKLLYSFQGGKDGTMPLAELIELNGKLYGTTARGGDMSCSRFYGCGTIFEIDLKGTHRVLHRFSGAPQDGTDPEAALIAVKGKLYGTTIAGGTTASSASGTVYEIAPSGHENVVYSFAATGDGQTPTDALVEDSGTLYGTTRYGGNSRCYGGIACGTIFATTLAGKEQVLYDFQHSSPPKDGNWPFAGLTLFEGKLYGVTGYGGTANAGTVFQISTAGKEQVLYSFQGGHDGQNPYGQLIGLNRDLYGTTEKGGSYGFGTVFVVSSAGKESVLYSFKGSPNDGAYPYSRLLAVNGKLYGTTENGGRSCFSGGAGCGTVFAMSTAGKETVLYKFAGGKDGAIPAAGLVEVNGTLYGTTSYGGGASKCPPYSTPGGCGTIFAIAP